MKVANSIFFILFGCLIVACKQQEKPIKKLPIVGNTDILYKTVNGKEVADTIYHVVPEFQYINQDSVLIQSKNLKDRVWITDFFFTNCPSICPTMTANMKRLNTMLEPFSERIWFLSFSIDPYHDTPTTLKSYIKNYGIKAKNWHFFTGDEAKTHLLAKEFFNAAEKNDSIPGGYGHTPYFTIIDTKGHVRGIYDGTNSSAIDSLANDMKLLLKTEYNVGN